MLRSTRYVPRHAKPSALRTTVVPVLAAGGMTAALAVADVSLLAGSASAASSEDFSRLRACESGGNYAINTGNGYYGAYQFNRGTWQGLGYSGLPHQASPATQDEAAAKLQAQRGWQPWPGCARKLGLSGGGGASTPASGGGASTPASGGGSAAPAPARRAAPAPAPAPRASRSTPRVVAPATAPAFDPATVLTVERGVHRAEVAAWQARMVQRGWRLAVDGYFGPQSAGVAQRFAAEKGLATAPGTLDKASFDGAWTLPVT